MPGTGLSNQRSNRRSTSRAGVWARASPTLWSSMVVRSVRSTPSSSAAIPVLPPDTARFPDASGAFDLVMLEVGAFHEAWGDIHLGPAHALDALGLLGGGRLLPVHWGTFNLAIHAWDEPSRNAPAPGTRTRRTPADAHAWRARGTCSCARGRSLVARNSLHSRMVMQDPPAAPEELPTLPPRGRRQRRRMADRLRLASALPSDPGEKPAQFREQAPALTGHS